MPQFCTNGQIARVTFPDGVIRDYPGPINLECFESYGNKNEQTTLAIGRRADQFDILYFGYQPGSFRYDFYIGGYLADIQGIFRDTNYTPINNTPGNFFVRCRGMINQPGSGAYGWFPLGDFSNYPVGNVLIYAASGVYDIRQKRYRIEIKDSSGLLLFEQGNFTNNNYSVNCVSVCPLNTIDCGDCCLDCQSTFNSISDIRRLISRLK
jgi:hypothetical protein